MLMRQFSRLKSAGSRKEGSVFYPDVNKLESEFFFGV